jgi:hypothetical protein
MAPDGTKITARFIGDMPEVSFAAPSGKPRTAVFALRVFAEVWNAAPTPLRRYLTSIDLDLYAPNARFVQSAPRINIARDLGTAIPRANYTVAIAENPPVDAKDPDFFCRMVAHVVNDTVSIYDEKLSFIGNVAAGNWDEIAGTATFNRRYVDTVPIPGSRRLAAIGHAQRTSGPTSIPDSLWVLDAESRTVVASAAAQDITGITPVNLLNSGMLQAGHDGTIYLYGAANKELYAIAPDLSSATAVALPGSYTHTSAKLLVDRAGEKLYLLRPISSSDPLQEELLVFDTSTMTQVYSTTIYGRGAGPFRPWCLAPSGLYVAARDSAGNDFVEVRNPASLTVIRKFPYTPASTSDRGFIVAPDESRIYVDRDSGQIEAYSTDDGALLATFDPNAMVPFAGTGATFKGPNNDPTAPLGFHAAR